MITFNTKREFSPITLEIVLNSDSDVSMFASMMYEAVLDAASLERKRLFLRMMALVYDRTPQATTVTNNR